MLNSEKQDYMNLYEAILKLETEAECAAFFEDLLTIAELKAAAQRFKVAGLLDEGNTCNAVAQITGASTATVSRVNKCLNYGTGYRLILDKLKNKK
ncbi:MAG: YerC/YecD family TrpR-related protein [Christensenellaceae bacterium]|jgi:TrpR-related protein YerC/YecD